MAEYGLAVAVSLADGRTGAANQLEAYNVIWDSPSADYKGSMPIGNGETGMNLWVEPNGDLVFLVSRTDSWDENEQLCKLGRIRVKFEPSLAGTEFRQELKLRQGEIEIVGGTGDDAIRLRAWVDANRQVIHLDADSRKAFGMRAELELWRNGSRTPAPPAADDPFFGLKDRTVCADTVLQEQEDQIVWYHRNAASTWEGTLRFQGLGPALEVGTDPLLHRTFGGLIRADGLIRENERILKSAAPRKSFRLSVHTHTQTSATEAQWLEGIESGVAAMKTVEHADALNAHREWWAAFWNRSWIFATTRDIPEGTVQSIVPSNVHSMNIGMDTRGGNRLNGEVGRVSVLKRVLKQDEIGMLAGRKTALPKSGRNGVLFSGIPDPCSVIPDSARWTDNPELTIETWVNPEVEAGSARIIDKGTPGVNDGFLLDTHPGNSLRLIIGDRQLNAPDCLQADEWNHVAVTVDSKRDRIELYLNGKLVAGSGSVDDIDDAFAVTRGYVLQRWINACGGRGNYPIKFNGSIFTVDGGAKGHKNPDHRCWGGGYWFQNTRLPYWPMLASGDFDMMQPMFRMYMDLMPLAKIRTKIYFDHEGAFFPETMSFWGTYHNGDWGWGWRTTGKPGDPTVNRHIRYHYSGTLELLTMMIDYYRHTEDKAFLTRKLLPVADEYLTWWDQHWDRDEQGRLHMTPSSSCETYWECTNPSPDIAGLMWNIDQLLSLKEIGAARRARWMKLRKAIPQMPMMVKGGETIIAPAEAPLPNRTNVENPELYSVFPFRVYGVGKPELELARDTFHHRIIKHSWGWAQDETQAAYLGLADAAAEIISERAKTPFNVPMKKKDDFEKSRFPAFWGPNYDSVPDQDHGGNLLMGLQTMILQADGGRIHLLPAWPDKWDLDFRLHAPRNTTVEGRVRGGKLIKLDVTPKSRERDVIINRRTEP